MKNPLQDHASRRTFHQSYWWLYPKYRKNVAFTIFTHIIMWFVRGTFIIKTLLFFFVSPQTPAQFHTARSRVYVTVERPSVLSFDSSSGMRRVCCWAPCGQEMSIDTAALLRVAEVTAGLAENNGNLPPGLWLTSPAGWLPRTGISSETLHSVIEYGLPLPFRAVQQAPALSSKCGQCHIDSRRMRLNTDLLYQTDCKSNEIAIIKISLLLSRHMYATAP